MSATSEQLEEVDVLRSIYEDAVETNPQWLTGGTAAPWHVRVKQLGTIARPMALVLRLPPGYPGSTPPVFEIVADWLSTANNAKLSAELGDMFRDAAGEPVLFSWVQHLSDYVHAIPRDAVVVDALAAAAPAPPPAPAPAPALVPSSVPVPAPVAADAGASAAAAAAGVEVFSGEPLSDRKSTFQAHACRVHSTADVEMGMTFILSQRKVARATHNIMAYRIVDTEHGTKHEDHDDDGEHGAGRNLSRLLTAMGAEDVLVVVTRWYGGIHLGPDRFRHINNVARMLLEHCGFARNDATKGGKESSKARQGKRGHKHKSRGAPRGDTWSEGGSTSGMQGSDAGAGGGAAANASSGRESGSMVAECLAACSLSPEARQKGGDGAVTVLVAVRAQPNSRSGPCIDTAVDGQVHVHVTEAAADGKANKALVRLISRVLRVPKSAVSLVSGHKSRSKVVAVTLAAGVCGDVPAASSPGTHAVVAMVARQLAEAASAAS